jgi:hypothetical protein
VNLLYPSALNGSTNLTDREHTELCFAPVSYFVAHRRNNLIFEEYSCNIVKFGRCLAAIRREVSIPSPCLFLSSVFLIGLLSESDDGDDMILLNFCRLLLAPNYTAL